MPKGIKRDNRNCYVGSGRVWSQEKPITSSQRTKVRFPSKKRSRYTWKKFYKLFPYWAEYDNWDGKTSDRMK